MSLSRQHSGLSVWEFLVVVAIAALLASLAIPGFGSLRRNSALNAAAGQLVAGLHLARSVSILRGVQAVVCLSADGHRCLESGSETASSWLAFVDHAHSSPVQIDTGDQILRSAQLPTNVLLRGTRRAITFWPVSRSGTTGTFRFCFRGDVSRGRAVVVSQTGRPRLEPIQGSAECTG
jgi:type IV fimbrial biogenesis protein FimT